MLRTPICPYLLAKLYKDGETIKNIAARFDCDLRTIRRRAERLGLRHPNSPQQRRKKMDTALRQINVIDRYEDGESLMELAASGDTSVDVVRGYLVRNDVEIRTRIEQAKRTMAQHGTRSPKTATRLYVYERDASGLVTAIKIYFNKSRKPVTRFIQ